VAVVLTTETLSLVLLFDTGKVYGGIPLHSSMKYILLGETNDETKRMGSTVVVSASRYRRQLVYQLGSIGLYRSTMVSMTRLTHTRSTL
jgi:hypothetical protein